MYVWENNSGKNGYVLEREQRRVYGIARSYERVKMM